MNLYLWNYRAVFILWLIRVGTFVDSRKLEKPT